MLFRATDKLYHTTAREFQVVECSECGLMRLDPAPPPEELATFYPSGYWYVPGSDSVGRLEEAYRAFVLGDHVRFVQRALKSSGVNGPVLDVGCGGGLFLRQLSQATRGRKVFGLDLQWKASRVAWRRNGVPAVCASLEAPPFAPGAYAAVTMFHVLEHVYDPAEYLQRAHELLAPGGRLIVQVPNASSWQFLLMGENWNGLDVPRHLTNFRQKDLEALLEKCGFEVMARKHFSLRDNPAGLATSLAPSLDPMARRMRKIPETPKVRLAKDMAYLAMVAAAAPFAVLEATCRAGASIMIDARARLAV
ncbi:MAG TPA: class I SAM-dependent methyltransferase [Bryobacteraceae bacterium]|nr:class I SAM-dependent methyltransferase [Bryobacteraceae bacterium]